jgi:hypothetical protein
MEIETPPVEYESPRIVEYGDLGEITAGSLHDSMHSDPHDPHRDPHLNHSIG